MSRINVDEIKPDTTNGSLSLKGDSGGSATTNGIVVDSSGKVGIGTNNPVEQLDIVGSQGIGLRIFENSSGNSKRLVLTQESDGVTYDATWYSGGNAHIFETAGVERMRIGSSGDVELTGGGDLTVNGTAVIATADINGGTIDGTTLGSTVVFPAGHVVQTTRNTYNSGDSAATTSATTSKVVDGSSNTYWSHTISGMTAGNHVLVNFSFVSEVSRNAVSAAGAWHIYRDNTIIYGSTDDFMQYISVVNSGTTSLQNWNYTNLVFLDTGATSTSHTYYLGYSSYSSSTVVVRSGSTYPPFVAILQEIQL